MPIYDYEPSLSFDHGDCASSNDDGMIECYPDTPQSKLSGRELEDKAVVVVSTDGSVDIQNDQKLEKVLPTLNDEEFDDLSPEARALLPAPNSCPRSGINLRRQSPTFGSSKSHESELRRTKSLYKVDTQPRLDDYLCACKYCPRAMTIQRAFQLYGFALDHPQSEALLRVLRACANYDETIMEVDPLLVLHAEKMLEELGFDENQTFRLLVASHFQRP
ncbi:uncharacterized protein PHALS_14287 [Plasmopara halstedii]|uniref:Uncharacterized protein n=1 Tax=Plasmopara halstedii TaxID=4781 RepID=A0A0P1ARL1_PLAHL|nr:uncharacterized protein PHALS_14287 [Plasmopara halstedii]CEG44014.1 hypothetical protein PHALS_14287 [Plasmopara halstedii]|eukprot:XP_024580383.1 hypothetical protein PHALS_14287 [Plasmopara halstedii]